MSLRIDVREVNGVVIVDLSGKITLGEATGHLRECIRTLIGGGRRKIVLNLKNLSYMDSAGLGELIGAFTSVTNAGGILKLLNVGGRALDLLQMTRLMTLFEFFDDEELAVGSFSK